MENHDCQLCGSALLPPYEVSPDGLEKKFRCRKCGCDLNLQIQPNGFMVWSISERERKDYSRWILHGVLFVVVIGGLMTQKPVGLITAAAAGMLSVLSLGFRKKHA